MLAQPGAAPRCQPFMRPLRTEAFREGGEGTVKTTNTAEHPDRDCALGAGPCGVPRGWGGSAPCTGGSGAGLGGVSPLPCVPPHPSAAAAAPAGEEQRHRKMATLNNHGGSARKQNG